MSRPAGHGLGTGGKERNFVKQAARLTAQFAVDEHVEVEATWG